MFRTHLFRFSLLSLVALAAYPVQAQNIVHDPGFEGASPGAHAADNSFGPAALGDGDWTTTQGSVFVTNSALAHSGSQAVDLAPGNPGAIQQTLATTPGMHYDLSFFADSDFPSNTFSVMFDGSTVPASPTVLPSTGFHYVQYTFLNLAASTNSTLLSFAADNIGDTFLDDVSVTPSASVPEPGNVALLLGMGLTGAGFLLRRRKQ